MTGATFYLALCAAGLVGEVTLIGRLTFADVLLAVVLPLAITRIARVGCSPPAKQFYIFAGIWFVGAVATDVIRHTPAEDIARGWSKIVFFIVNFTSINFLVDAKRRRLIAFIALLAVAAAVRLRMGVDEFGFGVESFGGAWKFGYGLLLAEAALLVSAFLLSYPLTRLAGMSLPFADAAINVALNARNLFGLTALSALALVLTAGRRRALSPRFVATMGAAALIGGWGLISIYGYAASSGLMGIDAKDKYELQASGSLGILLGGRRESLASTQAILDSPIIGHGSWARDITYVELMVTRLEEAGYEMQGDPFADDLIPSHSHLLGAWVEAGILGAVFWAWAAWVTVRGLQAAILRPTPLTGFVVFIGLSLLWDILFSPFGLERRVVTPACQ